MYNVIAHPTGEEPIIGEIDELPVANAVFLVIKNPRKRNGDYLDWLDVETTTLLLSFARLTCVEFSARTGQTLVRKYPDRERDYGASQA